MKIVHMRARVGEDRVLRIQPPKDTPTGDIEVTVLLEATRGLMTAEERRAAAVAGAGALRGIGGSVEEFLAARREEEQRRDQTLGL